MFNINTNTTEFLLTKIAESLDISNTEFEEAESRYRAVGAWLGEGNSPLASYSPQIYPQGSFLLGTVTKPLGDYNDYDIDLVFEVDIPKMKISQKELKNSIGNRLKAHELYKRLLDKEGRRCWTLQYSENARLHLDILPAIPDYEFSTFLQKRGVIKNLADTSIAITDNTLDNYEKISLDWPQCNPKGYANWFKDRMMVQFMKQRNQIFAMNKAEVAHVPDHTVKTPLQRSIQLLKRHRDIMFEGDQNNRPASIIFTTLAGHAYNNEDNIIDALINIVAGMPKFITKQNGESWVTNPVNPSENFADRWNDNPQRELSFMRWLNTLQVDMDKLINYSDIDDIEILLPELFGERVSRLVINSYKNEDKDIHDIRIEDKVSKPKSYIVPITPQNKPWGS